MDDLEWKIPLKKKQHDLGVSLFQETSNDVIMMCKYIYIYFFGKIYICIALVHCGEMNFSFIIRNIPLTKHH